VFADIKPHTMAMCRDDQTKTDTSDWRIKVEIVWCCSWLREFT